MRKWNRYAITINRSEADLVFVVRKGRLAERQLHGGISGGSRPQPARAVPAPGLGQARRRHGDWRPRGSRPA